MSTTPSAMISGRADALKGAVTVPGDKSISHRALMLSSQVLGTATLNGLLEGEDVLNTAKALQALGVNIKRTSNGHWVVEGVGVGGLAESAEVLDMGNSGTGTRLMMGLVTPYDFNTFFTGDDSLRGRPMARVTKPLTNMGAKIVSRHQNKLPLAVGGTANPRPITYRLPLPSAQVKSAVLLAALNTPGTTTVIEPEATRDHTERMLQYLGFTITSTKLEDGALAIALTGQQEIPRKDRTLTIPGDPSSAAFPMVAALLIPGSEITLENICINPLRTGLFITLKEMGASIDYTNKREIGGEEVADIKVKYSKLKGITVPAERAPSMIDEYPILSIAAASAEGKTVMEGLAELRVKESDRLSAVAEGLKACGVDHDVKEDTLIVKGGKQPKGGVTIAARLDHRIAMSFLVMGMVSEKPVEIDDGATINTSFPNFVGLMNGLGSSITAKGITSSKPLVIAIDGPAASGKGTLARRIAEHFGYAYLDTGSLYRAVGMKLIYSDQAPNNKTAAITLAKTIDEEDLANPRLRQERIGQAASIVSAYPEVRQVLLDYQREFAERPEGAVLDGRDIGTVVCPDADIKIFITATLDARAKRRHKELQGEGIEVVYESVVDDLRKRDERDQQRKAAPLVPAADAIIIDTSEMDANTVFEKALGIIEGKR